MYYLHSSHVEVYRDNLVMYYLRAKAAILYPGNVLPAATAAQNHPGKVSLAATAALTS
jgi:hypothetical protein